MAADVTGWMSPAAMVGVPVNVKEVNQGETTVRFLQEIYDDHDSLVEIHKKYPLDKGHRRL